MKERINFKFKRSLLASTASFFNDYKEKKEKEEKWINYYKNTRTATSCEPVFEETAKQIENTFESPHKKLRAWDIGTGTGKIPIMLAKRPNHRWEIIATDKHEKAIEITKERAAKEGITNITAKKQDVTTEPELENYQYITASRALPFIDKQQHDETVKKIVSHIDRGGCFVGHFFGKQHDWCKDKNVTCVTPDQIKPLFEGCDGDYQLKEVIEDTFDASGEQVHWHEIIVKACKSA